METGTLIVQKTSKGFAATIQFVKDNQTKSIPVLAWRPKDDLWNGKPCKFRRDKGQLTHLELEDGSVIFTLAQQQPQNQGQGGGGVQNTPDIFQLDSTRTPKDVRALAFTAIDNFYLKLNKFAYYENSFTDKYGNTTPLNYDKSKFIFLKTTRGGFKSKIRADFGNTNFAQLVQRIKQSADVLCKDPITIVATPDWKMALGLGHESVYETAMTLHHIYGIPYIPASGIKGVVRSYIIHTFFGSEEKKAIQSKGFCDLFGCPEELDKVKSYYKSARMGQIIFFDAYPLTVPAIEPDIMNPHYGDYYSSKLTEVKAPVDYLSPVPIHFLTITGTSFQFVAGSRTPKLEIDLEGKFEGDINSFLTKYLKEAITNQGIGAKTAVGYGSFSVR